MAAEVKEILPNPTARPYIQVTSDKFKSKFTVVPALGGHGFYEVQIDSGRVPAELQGKYTTMRNALRALLRYEHKAPKSKAVQRDERQDRKNAAKVQRGDQEHVRTGADNGEE